jgi:hypothetical protein
MSKLTEEQKRIRYALADAADDAIENKVSRQQFIEWAGAIYDLVSEEPEDEEEDEEEES